MLRFDSTEKDSVQIASYPAELKKRVPDLVDPAPFWWSAVIGLSLLCLGATYIDAQFGPPAGSSASWTRIVSLGKFSLTGENSIGSWWSGVLLLLASVLAMDGFVRKQGRSLRERTAWACLGLVLLILSLDEVGSLHERVGKYLPPYGWWALLPFVVLLAALATHGLSVLMNEKRGRTAAVLIATAFGMFALVAVQEELEHRTRWWGSLPGLRAALEEGTEIAAMLLLLATISRYASADPAGQQDSATRALSLLDLYPRSIATVLALTAAPLAYVTMHMPGADPGTKLGLPANWLGSVAFLLAALVVVRPVLWSSGPRRRQSTSELVIAASCVLMSVASVAIPGLLTISGKSMLLLAACTVVAFAWQVGQSSAARQRRAIWATSLVILAGLPLLLKSSILLMIVLPLCGAVVYLGSHSFFVADSDAR